MEPAQMAVIWMMSESSQRSDAASRHTAKATRPSRADRFVKHLRRIAYRAQLGPVSGHAAA